MGNINNVCETIKYCNWCLEDVYLEYTDESVYRHDGSVKHFFMCPVCGSRYWFIENQDGRITKRLRRDVPFVSRKPSNYRVALRV